MLTVLRCLQLLRISTLRPSSALPGMASIMFEHIIALLQLQLLPVGDYKFMLINNGC